ncbi:ATP-binding protein, partial [Candidatus Woesearchaeota archaeon]|nr:ATP-binding protein [Candidatus Woesearchaeota archaeon]
YVVVNALVEKIGPVNVRSTMGDLMLSYEDSYIVINTQFLKSVRLVKTGDLTSQEVEAVMQAYKIGNSLDGKKSPSEILHELGVSIYEPKPDEFSWSYLAGYDRVKQEIKDTVILPLQHPEVYEQIAQQTRQKYENIQPKAVLFEGPPGTGKTTCARIIAGEAGCQLVHVPIESIMSKWYGESERKLAKIFTCCQELGNLIIFLDEIDSLGISREGNIHEASRRILSAGIFKNYAKHLNSADLETLAKRSEELSGRNIKDICEHAERRWASRLISGEVRGEVPNLMEYLSSLKARKTNGL